MDTVLAAVISAVVALIGAIISYFANQRAIRVEMKRVEIELKRRLTEKLYDKRLEAYPCAFEITENLRGEYLFSGDISEDYLSETRQRLIEWNRVNGIFLSDETIKSYMALRSSLSMPKKDASTEEYIKSIWLSKNAFRSALRKDLNLLYLEERECLDLD